MEIFTERLVLREFTEEDAPSFLAYHEDDRSREFYTPEEARPEHARALLLRFQQWAVEQPRRNYQLAIVERWARIACSAAVVCVLKS